MKHWDYDPQAWQLVPVKPGAARDFRRWDFTIISILAALALGLVAGTSWPERLADAVALSAASVHAPVAGNFDAHAYRRYRPAVRVERLAG